MHDTHVISRHHVFFLPSTLVVTGSLIVYPVCLSHRLPESLLFLPPISHRNAGTADTCHHPWLLDFSSGDSNSGYRTCIASTLSSELTSQSLCAFSLSGKTNGYYLASSLPVVITFNIRAVLCSERTQGFYPNTTCLRSWGSLWPAGVEAWERLFHSQFWSYIFFFTLKNLMEVCNEIWSYLSPHLPPPAPPYLPQHILSKLHVCFYFYI